MSQAKYTRATAEAAGLTVDDTGYPWVAYRGPRFRPDEIHQCLTDLETQMLEALQLWLAYAIEWNDGLDPELQAAVDKSVIAAAATGGLREA